MEGQYVPAVRIATKGRRMTTTLTALRNLTRESSRSHAGCRLGALNCPLCAAIKAAEVVVTRMELALLFESAPVPRAGFDGVTRLCCNGECNAVLPDDWPLSVCAKCKEIQ